MLHIVNSQTRPRNLRLKYAYNFGDEIAYADTAAEIVAYIVDHNNQDAYLNAGKDIQAEYRHRLITQRFGLLKANLSDENEHPEFFETFDIMDAGESEITAFCQLIEQPVVGLPNNAWRFDESHVLAGRDPIPLYIIANDYEPFTSLPLPQGEEVYVLDWTNEVGFLKSTSHAGLGKFWMRTAMPPSEIFNLCDGLIEAAKGKIPPERVDDYDSLVHVGGEYDIAIGWAVWDAIDGLWKIPANLWPAIEKWTETDPYPGLTPKFLAGVNRARQAAINGPTRDGYLTLDVDPHTVRAVNEFVCPLTEGMTLDAGDIVWFPDADGSPFPARMVMVLYGEKEALFERVHKFGRPKPPSAT